MFGAGMPAGTAVANTNGDYYPPYPAYYSYGCGAAYDYAYGGYYGAALAYGPYGGAGKTAAYNPATGTYSRSAYAYGPYGSASVKQAYNPYTGDLCPGGAREHGDRLGQPGLCARRRPGRLGRLPLQRLRVRRRGEDNRRLRRCRVEHPGRPGCRRQEPVGQLLRRQGRHGV